MKCSADGKRWQWTTVHRGAADQGSAAVDCCAQGHGGPGLGGRLRPRRWVALAATLLMGLDCAWLRAGTQGTRGGSWQGRLRGSVKGVE